MRALIATALTLNISFASVVDDYLSSLKQEVLKTEPNFKTFDAKKGEEIFKSNFPDCKYNKPIFR